MTDRELIKKGYYEYKPTPFHDNSVEKAFQRRVKDEKGTKYFIDIEKYKPIIHPSTGEELGGGYEFTSQLRYKKNDCPLNLRMFAECTVEQFEEFMENLFNTGMFMYYEE